MGIFGRQPEDCLRIQSRCSVHAAWGPSGPTQASCGHPRGVLGGSQGFCSVAFCSSSSENSKGITTELAVLKLMIESIQKDITVAR